MRTLRINRSSLSTTLQRLNYVYGCTPGFVGATYVWYYCGHVLSCVCSLLLIDGQYTANGDSKTGTKAPKSPQQERKQSRFAALGRIFKPWKWKRRKKSEKIEAKAVGECLFNCLLIGRALALCAGDREFATSGVCYLVESSQ